MPAFSNLGISIGSGVLTTECIECKAHINFLNSGYTFCEGVGYKCSGCDGQREGNCNKHRASAHSPNVLTAEEQKLNIQKLLAKAEDKLGDIQSTVERISKQAVQIEKIETKLRTDLKNSTQPQTHEQKMLEAFDTFFIPTDRSSFLLRGEETRLKEHDDVEQEVDSEDIPKVQPSKSKKKRKVKLNAVVVNNSVFSDLINHQIGALNGRQDPRNVDLLYAVPKKLGFIIGCA